MSAEYRFKIDGAYTPATLPMERLAEYISALARLLGEGAQVHFRGVAEGSAVLVADVDEPARPKVRDRFDSVRTGTGPREAAKAFAELDDLLRADNATGSLATDTPCNVIPFPGKNRPMPITFGPFTQEGTLDGEVIRVGGKDVTVPVNLRDPSGCVLTGLYTTREIARELGHLLFGPTIRVYGTGKWRRLAEGVWQLDEFKIVNFEKLDDAPLTDVVARLRSAKGSQWRERADPVAEILADRHDEDAP
ncbi:hypothetical protein [Blastochloris tepida]|uniref:Uncharacterized protein n=1 Tax=Blastochloris tepida TaxID=2233851 RepID=A0A348FXT2_9HYPH|nr:hypothetical protein [Blastochloris tepida]BBF92115.1 hypothetical protein BLTE_08000 [Blastochloris tepida]